eukprot:387209-Amphidinium_carterae.1
MGIPCKLTGEKKAVRLKALWPMKPQSHGHFGIACTRLKGAPKADTGFWKTALQEGMQYQGFKALGFRKLPCANSQVGELFCVARAISSRACRSTSSCSMSQFVSLAREVFAISSNPRT